MSREIIESRPGVRETSSQSSLIANVLLVLVTLAIVVMGLYFGVRWLLEHAPLFWAANSGWFLPTIIIVVIGGSAPWTAPLCWRVFKAITSYHQDMKEREEYRLLLSEAHQAIKNGRDVELVNSKTGDMVKVTGGMPVVGRVTVTEGQPHLLPEKSSASEMLIPKAPPFSQVAPLITRDALVLCYTLAGPIFGTILDLLSMCVVGKPGRGKSTALLYYILILLKAGAEVWIWDPHSGLNELAYGLKYYDDLRDIEQSIPALHRELDERRVLWKTKKQVRHPLLLLIDELPVLADYEDQRAKEIRQQMQMAKGMKPEEKAELFEEAREYDQVRRPSRLLRRFVLEARKWNCYVILSGQALPADVLSTLTRDNLSSRIVFESCNMHARMAGLQKEEIDRLLPHLKGAGPGIAVMDVSRWSKPELAAIPNTTVEDLREYIDSLHVVESSSFHGAKTVSLKEQRATHQYRQTGPLSPSLKNGWPPSSKLSAFLLSEGENEVDLEGAPKGDEGESTQIVLSELEQRIVEMFFGERKLNPNAIAKELWPEVKGGDAYQKNAAIVAEAIRKYAEKKGA